MSLVATAVSERDIRDVILEYLHKRGVFVWRDKQAIPAGGAGHIRMPFPEAKGVSDLVGVMKDGRILCIEVKKPKCKPTPEQVEFLAKINHFGGKAFVAVCLDDVKDHGL